MPPVTRAQRRRARALDASSYPHLLERIIELASPEALAGLRGASRSSRTAVEKRLFLHLEIVFPPHSKYIAVVAKGTGLRLDWSWSGEGPDPPPAEAQAAVHRIVESAEVVDLDHDSYTAAHEEPTWALESVLQTMKVTIRGFPPTRLHNIMPDDTCPYYQEQAFNMLHGEKLEGTTVLFGMFARGGWSQRGVHVVEAAPGDISTKRKVEGLVVECTGGFGVMRQRKELVIHLVERTTPRLIKKTITQCLLTQIIHEHLRLSQLRGIIVGGAVEFKRLCGLADDASHEDFLAAADRIVDSNLDEYIKWGWIKMEGCEDGIERAELVKRWRKHVTFMTPEEYEAKVGSRQLALETRRDPNGPPAKFIE